MGKALALSQRLADGRSKRVVFLSHCLLNENTRYLGGATCGCPRALIEPYLEQDIGLVQMPCPEQQAWGGVLKRYLLAGYGVRGTLLYRLRSLLLPLLLGYTRVVYRRLARATAKQVADYLGSGFWVEGMVGVDGSPSCGLHKTLDMAQSFEALASLDIRTATVAEMNDLIRQNLCEGSGLYTSLLKEELEKRGLSIPYRAHDLMAELGASGAPAQGGLHDPTR